MNEWQVRVRVGRYQGNVRTEDIKIQTTATAACAQTVSAEHTAQIWNLHREVSVSLLIASILPSISVAYAAFV